MGFLVLTERGVRDLRNRFARFPSPLWLNPGLLPEEEIGRLRAEGITVEILPERLDPAASHQFEQVLQRLGPGAHEALWVEQVTPAATPPEAPAPEESAGAGWALKGLQQVAGTAASVSGRTWRYLKRRAVVGGPLTIIPYMSFGTPTRLFLQGRVLKDRNFVPPHEERSSWSNMLELYKRLGSDEVPGARVLARFAGLEQEIVADGAGYFRTELILPEPIAASGWQEVEVELLSPKLLAPQRVRAEVPVLVPPPSAQFGVISDIDDTVLWSNVSNKLKMFVMLALSNAHTRKPFKGVTAFYNALLAGASGKEGNPIFYVSSSPWHLYTPLVDFFQSQGIPLGPLLLKELGVRALLGAKRHHGHKLENIERILETYPHLPFVLIGDSGQQDPEIYGEIVQRHPRRVRAIYIRNVNPDPARVEAIDRLVDEVRSTGTQLLLVPDSEYAAAHAAAEGLIDARRLDAVRCDKRDDEKLMNPKI